MMVTLDVNSQLKVDSVGSVQIGNGSVGDADLKIRGTHDNGFYYRNKDSLDCGIRCDIITSQASDYMGLYSVTLSNKTNIANRTTAIRGTARTRCSTGTTIGVWGSLSNLFPAGKGTGILGSVSPSINNSLFDRRYAGFFNGITKVNGNFIVTGNIQGTLLGASASSSEGRDEEIIQMNVTNSLHGLTANRFYHEVPNEIQRAISTSSKAQDSSISTEPISDELMAEESLDDDEPLSLSVIEKQIFTKQHYGLDADQLEEVFPDLVYEDEDGTKCINYVEMVPILVQAINELSAKVEALESGNGSAKKIETRVATNVDEMGENVIMLALGQNKPQSFRYVNKH